MLPYRPEGEDALRMRASTASPALERSRQYAAAWRIGANVPRRCTAITASHSAGSMLTSIRSRRIPALLTSTSRRPKLSMARWTIAPAASKSDTSPPSTTASPPAATISSTTSCAGEASAPSPVTSAPRSLTTTLAPCRASDSACSRPIPRPAPVISATRSSRSSAIGRRLADRPARPRPPAVRALLHGLRVGARLAEAGLEAGGGLGARLRDVLGLLGLLLGVRGRRGRRRGTGSDGLDAAAVELGLEGALAVGVDQPAGVALDVADEEVVDVLEGHALGGQRVHDLLGHAGLDHVQRERRRDGGADADLRGVELRVDDQRLVLAVLLDLGLDR